MKLFGKFLDKAISEEECKEIDVKSDDFEIYRLVRLHYGEAYRVYTFSRSLSAAFKWR